MRNYYKPKKQNMAGNRFMEFMKSHDKLVTLLDISMVKDMKEARGKYSMNNNIIDISKKGERIWRF